MFSKLKHDFPASIVVFLVALPLCLGVALASGAPLLSGVISGIIGGIVVGFISDSQVSVSGPAAGLTAVVLSAIATLGAFDIFLLAVMIAGLIQLIAGLFKTGFIANYVPTNVIKGLLAAIGIILILKQIPHAFGLDRDQEGEFAFLQLDGENTFSELLNIGSYFSYGAVIITVLSMAILIGWDKTPLKKLKFIPASLLVVIVAALINILFKNIFPELYLGSKHLVQIPPIDSFNSIITLPDFSQIGNMQVWVSAITIAIIASIETLLNLEAVENIDPFKREASSNRELVAQGIGNMFSGLVGGIPITSVIVRSSVNVQSGAQTKLSTVLHGILLLVSIIFLSSIINLIPLSSLAAILLVIGYKLAKIDLFKDMYKKGMDQFIPFVVTIVAIVFTDLLVGIMIGLAVSLFFLLKSNYNNPFQIHKETLNIGKTIRIELSEQVSFLNKAALKEVLWNLPENTKVLIDAVKSDYIDHDVLELLKDFKETVSVSRGIQVNIIGVKKEYNIDDVMQFSIVLDKESQENMTAKDALKVLRKGNDRFVEGQRTEKNFQYQVGATSESQNPMAVVLSCIDSRTSPDIVFDTGLGDILSIRIAGNVMSKEIVGSIELACKKIGTKLIVVLGHSNCGAVAYAINNVNEGSISSISQKIEKAILSCNCDRDTIIENPVLMDTVIKQNVSNSIDELLLQSSYLSQKVASQEFVLVPAFYDTKTGKVTFDSEKSLEAIQS